VQNTTDPGRNVNRVRKAQRNMLIAIAAILIVIGLLYAYMQNIAATRAAQHKHSFLEYVTTNHLGSLITIDSGTGLDPMSYVMTLDHPLPDNQKEPFALEMSQRYYQYDHGQSLTVVYVDPRTHKQYQVAETQYNERTKQVAITVSDASGQPHQDVKQVNW
jgi:hypothetical protein